MSFIKRFSNKILLAAEKLYLVAHGWEEVGPDTWDSPEDYQYKKHLGIRQGHAVNSQKKSLFYELHPNRVRREDSSKDEMKLETNKDN